MDIQKVCQKCQGTGQCEVHEGSPIECDRCGGTGRQDEGEIKNASQTLDERMTEVEDKIDDIMTRCNDIFEKVNE